MNIEALQRSWGAVARVGDDAIGFFYSHLFLTHPEVREMFPISMATQRSQFFIALGNIVSNVDRLGTDARFVEQLGRDHRRFEVVPEHYGAAGASLLATLQHFLAAEWTDELAASWTEAYGVVARIMVLAAERDGNTPPWWDAEVLASERRSIDVAVHRIRPTAPYPFRAGQSAAVEIAQRPRIWRYYSPANAPRTDGTLDLHVQVVAGGQVSGLLAGAVQPGDRLRLGAPVGTAFTIDADAERPLLLVAGGTGLAPLRAVVDQIDQAWQAGGAAPAVHLLHGARTRWNLYDHKHLTALAARPWFQYTPVVSEDPSFDGQRGEVGAVAARAGAASAHTALVCGGPAMVAHTTAELTAAGMNEPAIRSERIGGPGAATALIDPDDAVEVNQWT